MAALISKDYRDYLPREGEPEWHNKKGAPITISAAFGGLGLVIGLVIGWTTELREAPPAVIGGLLGMLGTDFYYRFLRIVPFDRD